jgi:hypothetical protein
MPHEVVTGDSEGRPVGAFIPSLLAELGPLGPAAKRDAARAEGMLIVSSLQHDRNLI